MFNEISCPSYVGHHWACGKGNYHFGRLDFKMDHMRHNDHGQASDPHAGHKMSDIHGSHDRQAGHSVAIFRDKFWLSFALTIPVVFWSTDVHVSGPPNKTVGEIL